MLAEQGKLADLVEQNLIVPKRIGNTQPPAPKTAKTSKKDNNSSGTLGKKKKKGRAKVKRRR